MPFCHNCGAQVAETAKFCTDCGAKLKEKMGDIEELIGTLWTIGTFKNELPLPLRGWVSELGLFVQLRSAGGLQRLQAGGKFRSCFDALCRGFMCFDAANWKVRGFDQKRWDRHFAHLVQPTFEIALFLVRRKRRGLDERDSATLMPALRHFQATGEWLGFPKEVWCPVCDQLVAIGEWHGEACPHCGAESKWLRHD